MSIDRRSVVRRHNPRLSEWDPLSPFTVGNGEFAFTADVTGLQTFGPLHERPTPGGRAAMPLGTQSQWGYHWAPNPRGFRIEDTERPVSGPRGEYPYPIDYDFLLDEAGAEAAGQAPGYYFWTNPQRLHLGRLSLIRADGRDIRPSDISDVSQELDLWTGVLRSEFSLDGQRVRVTTTSHPRRDLVAVRVESDPSAEHRLEVRLDFPAVAATFEAEPVWVSPESHLTEVLATEPALRLRRRLDEAEYTVEIGHAESTEVHFEHPHSVRTVSGESRLTELVVAFSSQPLETALPTFAECVAASTIGWEAWWNSGAAVDFSGASDPRAHELERRVVLSQYQTAVNSAGSTPPQETGLVCNSWGGTFHLEMHWWHAAHFATWGRPEMLEPSLGWYLRILPQARATAQRHGLAGAQWPKHVGPEGIESPNEIGPLLVWQQPHPIHFAELVRGAGSNEQRVLEQYGEMVDETARCIASLLLIDPDGSPHLAPPMVPAQEMYALDTVWDPVFEVAYFRWALMVANAWRERRGLEPEAEWERLAAGLVLPVSESGRYDAVQRPPRTAYRDHPSMVGALGVVPDTSAIEHAPMRSTLDSVDPEWEWTSAWGWDFAMLAMSATRLGDAAKAFDYLMRDEAKNVYLPNGHNFQDARLPLYLPGNGGLLMAVSLLAGGWTDDEGELHRPTAPAWSFEAEGFPPRP